MTFNSQPLYRLVTSTQTYPLRNVTDLRQALEGYIKDEFKGHFKYNYDDNPPLAIDPQSQEPAWRSSDLPYSKQKRWLEKEVTSYCEYVFSVRYATDNGFW